MAGLVTGHHEVVVRETAVAALGSLGDPAGVGAVLAATTDVATVRRRAVLALAAFDGPRSTPPSNGWPKTATARRGSPPRTSSTTGAAEDP